MNKKKAAAVTLCAFMALAGIGCGKQSQEMEAAVTPVPTATPVPVTSTPTPMPTPTEAPKRIGVKTDTAKYVTFVNYAGVDLREIYIQDDETEEWGKNLIPSESSIRDKEQVQMFYEPQDDGEYHLKIVTENAEEFEIYSAELDDMKQAALYIEEGSAYLKYTSISSKTEKTTTDADSSDDTSYDEESTSEDQSYGSDYSEDYDSSGAGNGGYYEDDSYDDGNGDSYDDGYDDDYSENGSGGSDTSGNGNDDSSGNYGDETDGNEDGTGSDIVWDEDGNWSEY